MEPVLFQIRADDVDEVLRGFPLLGFGPGAAEGVVANMPLDHFRHQTVHGAARGGDEAQHIAAFRLAVQGTRQGLDLPANASHSVRQFRLLANRVRHGFQYTPVVYTYTWVGYTLKLRIFLGNWRALRLTARR